MKVRSLLAATAAVCALTGAASAHAATLIDVTSITISVSSAYTQPDAYLQVGEVVAMTPGAGAVDAALTSTATATDQWDATHGPEKAVDGDLSTDFYSPNGIYHSSSPSGSVLTITLAAPTDLNSLTIYGRGQGFESRDLYNVTITGLSGTLWTGKLDARNVDAIATANFAAPEPASWALMLLGLGAIGTVLRTQRRRGLAVAAA